jgi:F-type H+-transporting ATPase subunit gamma
MPSLKSLRLRITSVKSTQKITKALNLVAASKLRRAQMAAEAARPYAERMADVLASLAGSIGDTKSGPKLLSGTGRDAVHLLVVVTSERGLCGGFNTQIVRHTQRQIETLKASGKTVKILCVGRKGRDALKRNYANLIIDTYSYVGLRTIGFTQAQEVADRVLSMFDAGDFDVATLIYSRFRNVISQVPTSLQLIPAKIEAADPASASTGSKAAYEYEPEEEEILAALLPRNIAVQIFRSMLENNAGFYGAQMTAMDNATRNAGEMIKKLTLTFNRTRQAMITKELIEIISGAEAL